MIIAVYVIVISPNIALHFKYRYELPEEIVEEYFLQEHFALKPLISQSILPKLSKDSFYLIHTRSDISIQSLPTLSIDFKFDCDEDKFSKVEELITRDTKRIVIEHLITLKSESSLRTAIESWYAHPSKDLFIMVVDMKSKFSKEQVNFTRTCVDQVMTCSTSRKSFIIILHYPPSVVSITSCYPALFIGNWNHVFLDGIGDQNDNLNVKYWIRLACHRNNSNTNKGVLSFPSLRKLLPKAINYAVSHNIFYSNQVKFPQKRLKNNMLQNNFLEQQGAISDMMDLKLGDKTVYDLLSNKFAVLWTKESLTKILERSSHTLLSGISQLSMSMALKSTFEDAFTRFIVCSLKEMNEWKNIDILSNSHRNKESDSLFVIIYEKLPIMPLDELFLQQIHVKLNIQRIPLMKVSSDSIRFPFFYIISSFLDKVISSVLKKFDNSLDNESYLKSPIQDITCHVMHLLDHNNDDTSLNSGIIEHMNEKRDAVLATVEFVKKHPSLYQGYLTQFVEWKLGCKENSLTHDWLKRRIEPSCVAEPGLKHNIVVIHIIANKYRMEFVRLTAGSSDFIYKSKISEGRNNSMIDIMLNKFESSLNLLLNEDSRGLWIKEFFHFLGRIEVILSDEVNVSMATHQYIRMLSFFYLFGHSSASIKILEKAVDSWYNAADCKFKPLCKDSVSLHSFFDLCGKCDGNTQNWDCIERMLRHFFSPFWLTSFDLYWKEDLSFLLSLIKEGYIPTSKQQFAVSMIKYVCIYGGSKKNEPCFIDMSLSRLEVISSELVCENLAEYIPKMVKES